MNSDKLFGNKLSVLGENLLQFIHKTTSFSQFW